MSNFHTTRKHQSNQQPLQTAPTLASLAYSIDDIRYFVDGFLLAQRAKRNSQNTIRFYKWNLDKFIWFLDQCGSPTALEEITPNTIRRFFIYLQEQAEARWGSDQPNANKPLSAGGVHAFARALRAFFKWASKEARIPNPFENVSMPPLPNAWKVETFTDEEITTLFAACDRFGNPFTVQRNRTMLAILLDSGIRASELLGLEVGDISPQEGLFTVRGKGDKQRDVVVGTFARQELWVYLKRYRLKQRTPFAALFTTQEGEPLTYSGLNITFRKLRQLSGIQRVGVHAHVCRHTAATVMHRNGMRGSTLQEMLGHTKFDTTRRYYLDIAKEDLASEHAQYGPLDNLGRKLKNQPTSDCLRSGRLMTRPELPSAEVLAREVQASSYRATARRYGVSDTAIRKRLKKAGLVA